MHVQEQRPGDVERKARQWLETNLPSSWRADHVDYEEPDFDSLVAWERRLHQAGLAGVTWPQEHGGRGLGMREHLQVNRAIGSFAMPESVNSIGKELVGPILLSLGTPEQKRDMLPAILEMREIWCQGFSEPEAGSDLASVRTQARRVGNRYYISGQKIWTSLAHRAQRCILLARTGAAGSRHGGLSLFALPMDLPGITVRQIRQMTQTEGFCELFLDEVEVDETALIGGEDEGWRGATNVLSVERATNRMYRAWRFENELRHLLRVLAGESVLADGQWQAAIARTATDIEIVKAFAEDAVERLESGASIGQRGSLMKLHWSEAHQRFSALALDMLSGASGCGPALARARKRFAAIYLQARAETIYAGTSEIQLGIIADRIMQLPRAA